MESDFINLDELKSLYGAESAKELLEMSLREGRTLIASIKKSLPARNVDAVGADAHQLKGMSATMTMKHLSELSYKLELSAREQTWTDCESLLAQLEAGFGELEQILSKSFA